MRTQSDSEKRAKKALYNAAHKNEHCRYSATYRAKHREKVKKLKALYYAKNKKRVDAHAAERRLADTEKFRAARRRQYAKNVEKHRVKSRIDYLRRRFRRNGNGGTHTWTEWISLCSASNWSCYYCHSALTEDTVVREHKTPVARGGSNNIENLAVSCGLCNSRKGTMTADEFLVKTG